MTAPPFPMGRLEAFVADVLGALGVLPDHAETTAKRLLEADARGRTGHGIIRLPLYAERIEAGGYNLRPAIRIARQTPVSALVDGDNGLGQVVMTLAAETAIEKAQQSGMAWVGTTRSNHAGAAGIYPAMAVGEGLIAFYFAVANANGMPPWGGREPILGTNPIAIGVPAGDEPPFLLDIATTVASHGTIKVVAQAGEQMPIGWVVDVEGNPITDPNRADEGFLVPIGGYKGAGLNIAIGLLAGVLNDAAFGRSVVDHREHPEIPTNTGQAIFVMRPDLFAEQDEFLARVDAKLHEFRTSEPMGGAIVRLPGDRAAEVEKGSRAGGIEIPEMLLGRLRGLADRLGVGDRLE
ncbi:MAG TPA: Ldh family oxidoreductase [Acidimicrobiia bacterium]|jgi:LDH2 family malate/lactate/ureidoglycolate dehydrogenase